MNKPYIAASSYLNAAPLCYSFIYGEQKERCRFLSDAAPARCAELLAEGRADAALIPVIEYQRIPGLKVAPGACVASKSKVQSVVLASRVPVTEVRSVALDTSSRTSAALIQIILNRFYGLSPMYRTSPPHIEEMLESSDAALIIGDPAMLIDRTRLHVYDLAEEWRKHTGLPFVFAFWAIRKDSILLSSRDSLKVDSLNVDSLNVDFLNVDFLAAKREGVEHAAELAGIYSAQLGLPRDELFKYLTENISYDLDGESLRGLELYYEMAHECGLIEEARGLVFCD
jgi:chorismate dehydratase